MDLSRVMLMLLLQQLSIGCLFQATLWRDAIARPAPFITLIILFFISNWSRAHFLAGDRTCSDFPKANLISLFVLHVRPSAMPQVIYEKAVKRLLPTAIPTLLEKIDEYSIGKVLIYSKKPRKLIPTRKHHLDFTGWSMQSLLAEGEDLRVTTARSYLFDTGKDSVSKSFDVEVGGDIDLTGSAKVKVGDKGTLTVTSDFGKITHITADLVSSVLKKKFQVKADHPIVQKAIENGGVMFVINSIYEGEHCNVSATVTKDVDESASVGAGAKGDVSESVDDKKSSTVGMFYSLPYLEAYGYRLGIAWRVEKLGITLLMWYY